MGEMVRGLCQIVVSALRGKRDLVGGLDPDAPVQTKPSAVLPGKHIDGVVGLQEAVAGKVAEHALANGVLSLSGFRGPGIAVC